MKGTVATSTGHSVNRKGPYEKSLESHKERPNFLVCLPLRLQMQTGLDGTHMESQCWRLKQDWCGFKSSLGYTVSSRQGWNIYHNPPKTLKFPPKLRKN